MISVKILAHSAWISKKAMPEILTFELMYPRFIHSEFMTHRVFSRNASSSRAIPFERMAKATLDNVAMPVVWGTYKPGMQAGPPLKGSAADEAEAEWKAAAWDMYYHAAKLHELGLQKEITNRLLEPFQHIRVVVTSTQWNNFFELRTAKDANGNWLADPTIATLAEMMKEEFDKSVPVVLDPGEWHNPYSSPSEHDVLQSAAMCARVTSKTHDGKIPTRQENEALAERLLRMKHMSPFEHQARPARGLFANFHGWRSFRYDIENPDDKYMTPFYKYTPLHTEGERLEIRSDE